MGLLEDSRSKFNGSGSKGMIVYQRKYSFVQRKRIFLYKTVDYFFPGARVSVSWKIGIASRQRSGKIRKVDDAVAVEVTILNWPSAAS
jgi:hypothetical protein